MRMSEVLSDRHGDNSESASNSQGGWLSSYTSCLITGMQCTAPIPQQKCKSGKTFISVQGIQHLCLTDAPVAVASWKRRLQSHHIFVCKASYSQKEILSKELSDMASDMYVTRSNNSNDNVAKFMTLDTLEQRLIDENDYAYEENEEEDRLNCSFIRAMLDHNFNEALKLNEQIIETATLDDPMAHATALHNKGLLYLLLGNMKRSVYHFHEALEAKKEVLGSGSSTKKTVMDTMYQIAIALYAFGEIDRARSMFQAIQTNAPTNSETAARAWNGLGCCFYQKDREQQRKEEKEQEEATGKEKRDEPASSAASVTQTQQLDGRSPFALQCFLRGSGAYNGGIASEIALANLGYHQRKYGDPKYLKTMKNALASLTSMLGKDDAIVANLRKYIKRAMNNNGSSSSSKRQGVANSSSGERA